MDRRHCWVNWKDLIVRVIENGLHIAMADLPFDPPAKDRGCIDSTGGQCEGTMEDTRKSGRCKVEIVWCATGSKGTICTFCCS